MPELLAFLDYYHPRCPCVPAHMGGLTRQRAPLLPLCSAGRAVPSDPRAITPGTRWGYKSFHRCRPARLRGCYWHMSIQDFSNLDEPIQDFSNLDVPIQDSWLLFMGC